MLFRSSFVWFISCTSPTRSAGLISLSETLPEIGSGELKNVSLVLTVPVPNLLSCNLTTCLTNLFPLWRISSRLTPSRLSSSFPLTTLVTSWPSLSNVDRSPFLSFLFLILHLKFGSRRCVDHLTVFCSSFDIIFLSRILCGLLKMLKPSSTKILNMFALSKVLLPSRDH